MTIDIGTNADVSNDIKRCTKHQYDVLVLEYKKAVRNNHKELTWMGEILLITFAHYIIEYLSPRFKNMK